jgi:hypothetical protein
LKSNSSQPSPTSRTDAGVLALAVGRGELHHVAHGRTGLGVAQLGSRRGHALQQFRVALAEGLAGGQLEPWSWAPSARPIRRCSIAGASWPAAQRQRGRLAVEGVDDVGAVGPARR